MRGWITPILLGVIAIAVVVVAVFLGLERWAGGATPGGRLSGDEAIALLQDNMRLASVANPDRLDRRAANVGITTISCYELIGDGWRDAGASFDSGRDQWFITAAGGSLSWVLADDTGLVRSFNGVC